LKTEEAGLQGLFRPFEIARGDNHRHICFRSQSLRQLEAVTSNKQAIQHNEVRTNAAEEAFRAGFRPNHEAPMPFGAQHVAYHIGDIFVVFDQDDVGHFSRLSAPARARASDA